MCVLFKYPPEGAGISITGFVYNFVYCFAACFQLLFGKFYLNPLNIFGNGVACTLSKPSFKTPSAYMHLITNTCYGKIAGRVTFNKALRI